MYQDACLDVIQSQAIVYTRSLSCSHGGNRVACDGIAMSYRLSRSKQAQPWAANLSSEPIIGSLFEERLVQSRPARILLLKFAASGSTAGISLQDLGQLRTLLKEAAVAKIADASGELVPFLTRCVSMNGLKRADPKWRCALHDVATGSPAWSLLPKHLLPSGAAADL
jgi:hypothetical protein